MAAAEEEDEDEEIKRVLGEFKKDKLVTTIRKLSLLDKGKKKSRKDMAGLQALINQIDEIINEVLDQDENVDDVLAALAEELGDSVVSYLGREYAFTLLPLLENLAVVEEPVVRDCAVKSLCRVAETFTTEHHYEHFIPLLKRLQGGEWFTSRASACGLFSIAYKKVDGTPEAVATRKELREGFKTLVYDTVPVVRRAAALALGPLATALGHAEDVISDIVPLFVSLAKDDQDSVRLVAVDNAVAIAKQLPMANRSAIAAATAQLLHDKSWRVRYTAAVHLVELAKTFDMGILPSSSSASSLSSSASSFSSSSTSSTTEELVAAFLRLLKDAETEVRAAAIGQLAPFCSLVTQNQIVSTILPCVAKLAADTSPHVRRAVAGALMTLAGAKEGGLPVDGLVKHVGPLLLLLLGGEEPFPEVRLAIIASIDTIPSPLLSLLRTPLISAVKALVHDKEWRVRLACVDIIPTLASAANIIPSQSTSLSSSMNTNTTIPTTPTNTTTTSIITTTSLFDTDFSLLCMEVLDDAVYAIRNAMTNHLPLLTRQLGLEWWRDVILPKLLLLQTRTNYLHRMTTMFAVNAFISSPSSTDEIKMCVVDKLMSVIVTFTSDPVANVRFNAAKTLQLLLPLLSQSVITETVAPALQRLRSDPDDDVKYFASLANL